ncbi:translation elongation factor Ts [Oleiagrimonas sp.]|jgi:elongation factor Ts|uniref:translation elongation factor Ts n=1 Tax=Oleiagrimonas sp. TaxID=2010330 RepID=UPI002632F53A|nr:translation elongation factor Ts [Oleiagrimonas sp.]MDA3914844.1 translation elongation factor Ts [Oleiagrimonas sp.]
MQISAQQVKELRERSGAGMMECKKALVANEGDVDTAMEWLRKQGLAKADKKAGRVAAEGRIVVAMGKGKAVMVEVNCETDFVAKDDNFLNYSDNVAKAALDVTDIDALKTAAYPGGSESVEDTAKALIAKIGENIQVRRMARVVSDGVIGNYVHGGRIGVLVALKGGDEELAKGIAMHVAAMNPTYISPDQVPDEVVAKEKDIAMAQVKDSGKPAEIIEKMISGKLRKAFSEVSLTGQPYVLDTNSNVGDVLKKEGAEIIAVERLAVGEGIEKAEDDFAAEVMKQAGLA